MFISRLYRTSQAIVHLEETQTQKKERKNSLAQHTRTLVSNFFLACVTLSTLSADDALSNAVIKARMPREYHDNRPNDG